jgi:hypothetical protein
VRHARDFKLMGRPEMGLRELEAAHRLAPENLQVADALAHAYDELGLGARAQEIYREALFQAPDNPALQNNRCFSHYQAGELEEAEACYRRVLAGQPDNQAARNNLGLVLCRLNRFDEARRLWQDAQGEGAAAQKLQEVLAALGMAADSREARTTRPQGKASAAVHPSIRTAATGAVNVPPAAPPMASPGSPALINRTPAVAQRAALPPPGEAGERAGAVVPPPSPPGAGIRERAAGRSALIQGKEAASDAASVKKTASAGRRGNGRRHLTAHELSGTRIAIRNGNGVRDLARETRARLSLEGYSVVDINNFRDFGVAHTTIYYRPESQPVAEALKERFFPGAEIKAASRLADRMDIQVVLGHDLCPQSHAGVLRAHPPRL